MPFVSRSSRAQAAAQLRARQLVMDTRADPFGSEEPIVLPFVMLTQAAHAAGIMVAMFARTSLGAAAPTTVDQPLLLHNAGSAKIKFARWCGITSQQKEQQKFI